LLLSTTRVPKSVKASSGIIFSVVRSFFVLCTNRYFVFLFINTLFIVPPGQIGQNESQANLDSVYEYDLSNDMWMRRMSMPFGRGHTGTSSIPFGCGFIVAGGAVNSLTRTKLTTNDISYYSTYTDTWVSIGTLPKAVKTPVCGIVKNPLPSLSKYLYCTTGYSSQTYRREIKFSDTIAS
jgi:hypothetical protein